MCSDDDVPRPSSTSPSLTSQCTSPSRHQRLHHHHHHPHPMLRRQRHVDSLPISSPSSANRKRVYEIDRYHDDDDNYNCDGVTSSPPPQHRSHAENNNSSPAPSRATSPPSSPQYSTSGCEKLSVDRLAMSSSLSDGGARRPAHGAGLLMSMTSPLPVFALPPSSSSSVFALPPSSSSSPLGPMTAPQFPVPPTMLPWFLSPASIGPAAAGSSAWDVAALSEFFFRLQQQQKQASSASALSASESWSSFQTNPIAAAAASAAAVYWASALPGLTTLLSPPIPTYPFSPQAHVNPYDVCRSSIHPSTDSRPRRSSWWKCSPSDRDEYDEGGGDAADRRRRPSPPRRIVRRPRNRSSGSTSSASPGAGMRQADNFGDGRRPDDAADWPTDAAVGRLSGSEPTSTFVDASTGGGCGRRPATTRSDAVVVGTLRGGLENIERMVNELGDADRTCSAATAVSGR